MPEAGEAVVVIYRPAQFHGSIRGIPVVLDGKTLGNIGNGTRMQFAVAPGQRVIETLTPVATDFGQTRLEFFAKPKATYWLILSYQQRPYQLSTGPGQFIFMSETTDSRLSFLDPNRASVELADVPWSLTDEQAGNGSEPKGEANPR